MAKKIETVEDKEKSFKEKLTNTRGSEGFGQLTNFLGNHRRWRNTINSIIYALSVGISLQSRHMWSDPNRFRLYTDLERQVGLLEGAMIQNPLVHPDQDQITVSDAPAGRNVAYDFDRVKVFGNVAKAPNRQLRQGRLLTFLTPEIMARDPQDETPLGEVNMLDVYSILHIDFLTPGQLAEKGLLEEKTYGEIYDLASVPRTLMRNLILSGHENDKAYAVTPKGNTAIIVMRDTGSPEKSPEARGAGVGILKPSVGGIS